QTNSALTYNLQGVATSTANGEAMLRLGLGRAHGRSLQPTVTVNGTEVEVPTDFRGDAQVDRSTFFGVIEIEVPYDLLTTNNTVTVTFPDGVGHVSSVSMQVFEFSGVVHRSEGNTVSIPAAEELGLRVFPNPAQTTITFDLASQQSYQLSVYDTQGRVVTNRKMQGRDQLTVASWPTGVYYYKVRMENGVVGSGRLVVQ
ncbi:MAG: T9SS type A sorting domain-containing protein, partial [Bacteroidota bacterium]